MCLCTVILATHALLDSLPPSAVELDQNFHVFISIILEGQSLSTQVLLLHKIFTDVLGYS